MKEKEIHDGYRVLVLMNERGWSKVDFATELDVHRTTLNRMLNNPHWPTNYLHKASRIFGENLFAPYCSPDSPEKIVILVKSGEEIEVFEMTKLKDFNWKELLQGGGMNTGK